MLLVDQILRLTIVIISGLGVEHEEGVGHESYMFFWRCWWGDLNVWKGSFHDHHEIHDGGSDMGCEGLDCSFTILSLPIKGADEQF